MNKNTVSTANQTTLCGLAITVNTVNDIYALVVEKHFFGKTESQNIHDALRYSGTGSSMD